MAFNISYIFQAVDKFSAVGRKVSQTLGLVEKHAITASKSLGDVSKKLSDIGKKAFVGLTLPIGAMAVAALKASASMESMQTSFEILLQSKDKAANLMKDVKKFAEFTPFELTDISASITQLLGAGVPLADIIKKMTMLADVASAVNVPLTDMTHIFSKSLQKGKAQAEELNQMAERGIPIMAELAKMAKVPVAQIYQAAEKGQITYAVILKALERMTKEGGMFYKSSIIQSKTLMGIWGTLKDAIFFTLDTIGSTVINAFNLKPLMISAIKWLENFQVVLAKFVQDYPKLSKFIVILLAVTSVLAPLLLTLGLVIKVLGFMGIGIKALAIVFRLMFLGPLGLIIGGIALLVVGLIYAYTKFETFRKVVNFIGIAIWTLIKGICKLAYAVIFLLNPFTLLSAIGKKLYDNFKPFRDLIDWLVTKFNAIPMMVEKIGTAVSKFVAPIGNLATQSGLVAGANGLPANTPSPFRGLSSPIANSVTNANATVSININDKNNNVKSVQTTKKGFMELAVGKNMAGV